MSTAAAGGGGSSEGTAKATVSDQISQAIQSTSNLLQLMQQSSPSQNLLSKLPKNLLAKASTIKNTGQVIEQMPRVISALDAHMESGLHRAPVSGVHTQEIERNHNPFSRVLLMDGLETEGVDNKGLDPEPIFAIMKTGNLEYYIVPRLQTVIQLLSNMDSCQLNSTHQIPKESELSNNTSEARSES